MTQMILKPACWVQRHSRQKNSRVDRRTEIVLSSAEGRGWAASRRCVLTDVNGQPVGIRSYLLPPRGAGGGPGYYRGARVPLTAPRLGPGLVSQD